MIIKWTLSLIDRIFTVAGAVLLAQFPQFFQQYTQRLGGHVSELNRQVNAMQNAATSLNLSLSSYIQKFVSNEERIFSLQGTIMQDLVERYHSLSLSLRDFQEAPLLKKPFLFIAQANSEIVEETWNIFQPGLPTTIEGLVYALTGLVLGSFFFFFLKNLCKFFIKLLSPRSMKDAKAVP